VEVVVVVVVVRYHGLGRVAVDLVVLLDVVAVATHEESLAALGQDLDVALVVLAAQYLLVGVLHDTLRHNTTRHTHNTTHRM
jgi:hypothetical protein